MTKKSNGIYIKGFVMKGKVLKIDKEKVTNTCGRDHYVTYVIPYID